MFVLCVLLGFLYDCCTLLCIAISCAVHLAVTQEKLANQLIVIYLFLIINEFSVTVELFVAPLRYDLCFIGLVESPFKMRRKKLFKIFYSSQGATLNLTACVWG